ncbi:MAG: FtsQ-type POTRA domain-containing protein [Clostridiales Family XIII bacterium]|jgi:cell division protein FtsQ|nr:FtsQ-type POTRA domain-containing protein [Clostridiales Family XIII bacterium]
MKRKNYREYEEEYGETPYAEGRGGEYGGYGDGYENPGYYGYDADDAYAPERPRKKRRKKHYFLRFLVFLLILGGIGYGMSTSFFDIADIEVNGNTRYTTEQITELSGLSKGMNIFYKARTGKAEKALLADPYIKSAEVKRKLPDKIRITVEERAEDFAVLFGEKYYTLDENGVAVAVSDTPPNVTLVEGLDVTAAEVGQEVSVEKNLLLKNTLSFLSTVRENGLYFRRIDATDLTIKAYLNDNLHCEGTYAQLERDIAELKTVLSDLQSRGIQTGTIIANSGSCTYSPGT